MNDVTTVVPGVSELIERGRLDEALTAATAHLRAARGGGHAEQAAALLDEARAQWAKGEVDDAVMTVDEAITEARRAYGAGDPHYAEALELGAEIAAGADMPNAADARFRGACDLLRAAGITGYPLGHALYHHGSFRLSAGDAEGAARAFDGALDALQGAEDVAARREYAVVLTALARVALGQDRLVAAEALANRALETWVALRQARRFEVADAMAIMGEVFMARGRAAEAVEWFEPACEIYEKSHADVRERRAATARHYAAALREAGRLPDALRAYEQTLGLLREGDPRALEIQAVILEVVRQTAPTPAG